MPALGTGSQGGGTHGAATAACLLPRGGQAGLAQLACPCAPASHTPVHPTPTRARPLQRAQDRGQGHRDGHQPGAAGDAAGWSPTQLQPLGALAPRPAWPPPSRSGTACWLAQRPASSPAYDCPCCATFPAAAADVPRAGHPPVSGCDHPAGPRGGAQPCCRPVAALLLLPLLLMLAADDCFFSCCCCPSALVCGCLGSNTTRAWSTDPATGRAALVAAQEAWSLIAAAPPLSTDTPHPIPNSHSHTPAEPHLDVWQRGHARWQVGSAHSRAAGRRNQLGMVAKHRLASVGLFLWGAACAVQGVPRLDLGVRLPLQAAGTFSSRSATAVSLSTSCGETAAATPRRQPHAAQPGLLRPQFLPRLLSPMRLLRQCSILHPCSALLGLILLLRCAVLSVRCPIACPASKGMVNPLPPPSPPPLQVCRLGGHPAGPCQRRPVLQGL